MIPHPETWIENSCVTCHKHISSGLYCRAHRKLTRFEALPNRIDTGLKRTAQWTLWIAASLCAVVVIAAVYALAGMP